MNVSKIPFGYWMLFAAITTSSTPLASAFDYSIASAGNIELTDAA